MNTRTQQQERAEAPNRNFLNYRAGIKCTYNDANTHLAERVGARGQSETPLERRLSIGS